ncbi:MAG: hypothetical protein K8S16_14360 [Bacteroidales bacterium]|nr:hypothetical protein [Bacteroidales bacterium]
MKRSSPNNNFNNFFRDRYRKHTIAPEEELWENINSRMNQKKLIISLKKIQRLKIAVTVLTFALIGTLTLIVTDIFQQENVTTVLQEQPIPDLPDTTKSKKPLNPVRKVELSNQEPEEQDIPEIDSSEVILTNETNNNIIDNINSQEVTTK